MTLTIGKVADLARVNIQTVRFYERRGLVAAPRRSASGYRQYGEDVVARLQFIKHAQHLGFSLNEIRDLLALRVRHSSACDEMEQRTREKVELVRRKIVDLERIKHTLEELATACATRRSSTECPILEALGSDATTS